METSENATIYVCDICKKECLFDTIMQHPSLHGCDGIFIFIKSNYFYPVTDIVVKKKNQENQNFDTSIKEIDKENIAVNNDKTDVETVEKENKEHQSCVPSIKEIDKESIDINNDNSAATASIEETSIAAVQERPALWDKNLLLLQCILAIKKKLWQEIEDLINTDKEKKEYTIAALKIKWIRLCDSYQNILIREISTKRKSWQFIKYMFDDENDHPTESEEGNIVELSSSSSYTKTLDTEFEQENDSNKEDNGSVSIDESLCSNSDEHVKKEITISECKKLCSLAAQLTTKFDIQTLEKLISLIEPNVALMQHNSRSENKLMFFNDMFLVKNPALGTALNKAKSIYCLQEKYIEAENATSATAASRRLLDGVFTPEALSVCSLSGMPPRSKGKLAYADKSLIKPCLCPNAVTAIIDKALQFQKIQHWRPKKDTSQIRQAMAVRINEVASKFAKEDP